MAEAVSRPTPRRAHAFGGARPARRVTSRLYTIISAYLHHEEKEKGSLEVGKLADLILTDRDYLTCPVRQIPETRVLLTVVGEGKE